MNKNDLLNLVNQGKSIAEIASYFGKGKTTIRYWLKKHDLKTTGKAGTKKI